MKIQDPIEAKYQYPLFLPAENWKEISDQSCDCKVKNQA